MAQLLHELQIAVSLTFAGGPFHAVLSKLGGSLWNLRKLLSIIPSGPFRESDAGPAPDYSQLENWIAHPSRACGTQAVEDANYLAETGHSLPPVEARPCDCFFLVDSCFTPDVIMAFPSDKSLWNAPLSGDDGSVEKRLAAKILEQMQMRAAAGASCFNRTCRIYAPRWRQVNVLALVGHSPSLVAQKAATQSIRSAMNLAYEDLRQAFIRFIDDASNSHRPFILAGHSQGSMQLIRLLQEEVENHPTRLRRFVHAYLSGFCIPMELFGRTLRNIRPSESASDTCTVSSWRTGAEDHKDIIRAVTGPYFCLDSGWRLPSQPDLLANNPITWTAQLGSPPSDPAEHGGALWPLPSNIDPRQHAGVLSSGVSLRLGHLNAKSQDIINVSVPALVRVSCGQITARLDEVGMVRVPRMRDSLFSLAERDHLLYHDLDNALFHVNIAENAALRFSAWKPLSKL